MKKLSTCSRAMLLASFLVPALAGVSFVAAAETKPGPYTWHTYRDELLAFNQETLAGAYKAHAQQRRWDADAVAFLDRMASYFSNSSLHVIYQKDRPDHAELIEAGAVLQAAGCNDPLVLYCYGVALHDSGKPHEALPLVQAAADGIEAAGYPRTRVVSALMRLQKLSKDAAKKLELDRAIREHQLAIAGEKLDALRRRVIYSRINEYVESLPRADAATFLADLKKRPETDPWVLAAVTGKLEIQLAWDSRGSGWANTVTEEGWKGFHDHLGKARDSLAAAYEIAPQLPEPATEMITVAMGDGGELGEDEQAWFDRATAAQLDYTPAYDGLFHALQPRWGGSHAAMYDLGLRGMQTNRYDTIAPWQLVNAVKRIGSDNGQGWNTVTEPAIYDALVHVAEQYSAVQDKDGEPAWYMTFRAAVAWRAQKYADAKSVLEKLGDRISPPAFAYVDSQDPPAAIGHAILMGGQQADDVRKAEEALRSGQFDEAMKAFQSLRAAAEASPLAKPYLDARLTLVDRRSRFQKGEPFDVQPKPLLAGWSAQHGRWTVNEAGELVGESPQYTTAVLFEEPLGTHFELTGVFEPIGEHGGRPGVALGRANRPEFYVAVGKGFLVIYGPNNAKEQVPVEALNEIHGPQRFVMTYAFGRMSLSLNGTEVLTKRPVPAEVVADVRAGVCTSGTSRFTELKVRNLSAPAAKPAETK